MKRTTLVLDGRLSDQQWDTRKTIKSIHDIPSTYCKTTILFPIDAVDDTFIKTTMDDKKLMKDCIAVIIHTNAIEFFYWNK